MKIALKGVNKVRSRGHDYYYLGRGKGSVRLKGKPGSPEFAQSYLEALQGHDKLTDPKKMAGLVQSYRASAEWRSNSDNTRKLWARWLDRIENHFGKLRVAQFNRPMIKQDVRAWRDSYAATPRAADTAIQVLSRVLSYAVAGGSLSINACEGMGKLYGNDRSDIIVTPSDLISLQGVASKELMWTIRLAALTGLRQDDIRTLRWSEVGDLAVEKPTGKSRRRGATVGRRIAVIPIYRQLRELLTEIPRVCDHVVTNSRGEPWRTGLSDSFHDAAATAGIIGKTFHDLRGTAATMLYQLPNMTLREIAEILAWEEDHVERIINRYVNRAAIMKERIRRIDENDDRTQCAKQGAKQPC